MKRTLLAAVLFLGCGGNDPAPARLPPTTGEACDFYADHFCRRLLTCRADTVIPECLTSYKKGCCGDNGTCARVPPGGTEETFEEYKRVCAPALDVQPCAELGSTIPNACK